MGLRYSIDLYYRIDLLEDVLSKIPNIAELEDSAMTTIELPNGSSINLPFTSESENYSVHFLRSQGISIGLDTLLIFTVDELILDYVKACNFEDKIDWQANCVPVGRIYLYVRAGYTYVELSFGAATSQMSRLFLDSKAIQDRFIEFMNSTDSSLGIIDIGEDYDLLLTNPVKKLIHNLIDLEIDADPYCDIDLLVAEYLNQI